MQRKIEGYYVTKDDIQNQKRIVAEHEIAVKKAEAVVKKLEKEEEQCEGVSGPEEGDGEGGGLWGFYC